MLELWHRPSGFITVDASLAEQQLWASKLAAHALPGPATHLFTRAFLTAPSAHALAARKEVAAAPCAACGKLPCACVAAAPTAAKGSVTFAAVDTALPGGSRYLTTLGASGNKAMIDLAAAPANPHGRARFVVKAQTPGSGYGAIMLYDRSRTSNRLLQPSEQPAYGAIFDIVQRRGCMKAYVWAVREGATVRVFTTELPPERDHMGVW